MEASPLAIALIGVIGGLLIAMLSLLIAMIVGLKKDMATTYSKVCRELEEIKKTLSRAVLIETYSVDKHKIEGELGVHKEKIIRLEIKVFPDKVEVLR